MSNDLDAPIWGARAIAEAANLFKKDKSGKRVPDDCKSFYLLETGAIRAKQVKGRDKQGKEKDRGQWVTTRRLILQSLGVLPDGVGS